LVAATTTLAADICTYTSRSCIGSYGCCYGIAEGTCCYWPSTSGLGWSVQYSGMPTTPWWLGRAYGDLCTTITSGVGAINWVSANWDSDYRTRRSLEGRDNINGTNCVLPNVVGFTTEDGKEHKVKVPEGKFGEVNDLLKEDNFEELLKLE
ncbi:hypothetical protein BDQ17DRAFT_1200764, partial [Cyathus striatus]